MVQIVDAAPTPDAAGLDKDQLLRTIECRSDGCFYLGTDEKVDSWAFVRADENGIYHGNGSDLKEEQFTAKMLSSHNNINPGWRNFDVNSLVTFFGAVFRTQQIGDEQDETAGSEMAQCNETYNGNGFIQSVVVADKAWMLLSNNGNLRIKNTSGRSVLVSIANRTFGKSTGVICDKI